MEPSGGPNFEAPLQPASPESQQGQQEGRAESPPSKPEQSGNRPQAPALPAVPDDIPVADQPVIAVPAKDNNSSYPADPKLMASNPDNIEREWVDKVKNIIAHTQDDPHLQKEQMSQIKAEYIQKRFNKSIKTTDEAAA